MKYRAKSRIRRGSPISTFMIYAVVVLLCVITLYPLWYVLVISLSDPIYASTLSVYLWPKSVDGLYMGAYQSLMTDSSMWVAYKNSIIYTLAAMVLTVALCATCAYSLASPRLVARKYFNFYLLIPMYFSGGLIPTFLLMTKLGLYNNRWAIILPASVNIWYIILTRTYFASIPEELREAARIDGANNYRCLFEIYIPNAKPILAVIAIYTMVARWNAWYDALVYLTNPDLHPLQLYLRRVLIEQTVNLSTALSSADMDALVAQQISNEQLRYAMIIFTTLPMIFVYPFMQRYFTKGVMVGSLKG